MALYNAEHLMQQAMPEAAASKAAKALRCLKMNSMSSFMIGKPGHPGLPRCRSTAACAEHEVSLIRKSLPHRA